MTEFNDTTLWQSAIRLPLPADLTHHETLICIWLASDPPLLEQTRLLIADDETYNPVPYDWTVLSSFVFELLYDPMYSHFPAKDLWGVMQNGGDMATARNLRILVTERALYDIEKDGWDRIRAVLLAEPVPPDVHRAAPVTHEEKL